MAGAVNCREKLLEVSFPVKVLIPYIGKITLLLAWTSQEPSCCFGGCTEGTEVQKGLHTEGIRLDQMRSDKKNDII